MNITVPATTSAILVLVALLSAAAAKDHITIRSNLRSSDLEQEMVQVISKAASGSIEDSTPRFDFGLPGGLYLQLREKVNKAGSKDALCDCSSKSISGYMDLKGSKVGIKKS